MGTLGELVVLDGIGLVPPADDGGGRGGSGEGEDTSVAADFIMFSHLSFVFILWYGGMRCNDEQQDAQ